MRDKRGERVVVPVTRAEKRLLMALLNDGETIAFCLRRLVYQEARRRGFWPPAHAQAEEAHRDE